MWHVKQLVFHGAVILLIGFLCGAPLGSAIVRGKPEEKVRAWRVAHSSLVAGGILLLAVAGVLDRLMMDAWSMLAMVCAFIAGSYAFVVTLPLAALLGRRGLAPGATLVDRVLYTGNMLGALALLAGGGLLLIGAYAAI